jgi:riboflavin kinase/FMN adenylyltransferase
MIVQRGFEDVSACRGGYVSIGNFDGVHRGHQRILSTLTAQARREGAPAVAFTFDPPPVRILAPDRAPPNLSTVEWKAELIAACGVDVLISYPTDRAFLSLTPQEFFDRVVRQELQARGLVEGPNFFFGRDRTGNVETLREMCAAAGLAFEVVTAVTTPAGLVSSSAIRAAVNAGRMREAVEMLGHPYRLTGRVERGAARGRTLGFPTANLAGVTTLLPPNGVYAGLVQPSGGGKPYAAAAHLGPNATFGESARKLEVHLLDYDGGGEAGELYDQTLAVDLLDRVRDTMKFPGPEALQRQLKADVERVRELVSGQWSMVNGQRSVGVDVD